MRWRLRGHLTLHACSDFEAGRCSQYALYGNNLYQQSIMVCPHCTVGVRLETEETDNWEAADFGATKRCYTVAYGHCPECTGLIILLRYGKGTYRNHGYDPEQQYLDMGDATSEQVIYPATALRSVDPEVPDGLRTEFQEAAAVLPISPKASAALSRRILQVVLREYLDIRKGSLADEIDSFLSRADVPTYLAEAVDAVRHVGNFAAHPMKDGTSGAVVDVEPGEAEWLLEVVDSFFDYSFVQPKRLAARRDSLNKKLTLLGKPPMKGRAPSPPITEREP